MLSVLCGVIFLMGFAAHVRLTVMHNRERGLGKSSLAWNACYGIALAGFGVMGLSGLIEGQPHVAIPTAAVATALLLSLSLATVSGMRERLLAALSQGGGGKRRMVAIEVGLLVLFGATSVLTMEMPWSHAIPFRGPSFWWLEFLLVTLAASSAYLVSGRRGAAVLPVHAFCLVIGIAQYFVRQFKNSAILPSDLMVLDTAVSVSGQYRYALDPRSVMGIAVSFLAVYVLSLLSARGAFDRPSERGTRERVTTIATGLLCACLCAGLVTIPNYMGDLGVEIMYWYSIRYYERQGFLPTFIAIWQDMPIRMPEGYTEKSAKAVLRELNVAYDEETAADDGRQLAREQFAEDRPTIIAVMNESFSDLSEYDGIRKAGYDGPRFFKTLPDPLFRGRLYVNVHGGGTCNSEFEFLTGNSLGYIGAGKYPYSSFRLDATDSLARQLGGLGYSTTAIHPNYASNWNRSRVYPALGFDRFLDIGAFGGFPATLMDGTKANETPTGVPVFHSGVSDKATYEKIMELLDENKSPQLIFDVTMQNHGSYNQGNIPQDKMTHFVPEGVYGNPEFGETPERLNEYLSCIEESDRALEWFVSQLRKTDRKVVLVFFGDHQPSLTPAYNDAWYPEEDDLMHSQRIYHANYLVWANYDVPGASQEGETRDLSVDGLASVTLEAIGAPLSRYQKAQLETEKTVPAINLHGYLGYDGRWYTADEPSEYRDAYERMSLVEYLNFAAKL